MIDNEVNHKKEIKKPNSEIDFWDQFSAYKDIRVADIEFILNKKYRSSSIFPVWRKGTSTVSVSWLNYWVKKHNSKVVAIITARNISGDVLKKTWFPIDKYGIENIKLQTHEWFESEQDGFVGSLEVEIYSQGRPFFNYPAISLIYANEKSSSVVHSCIRMLNEGEIINDYAISFPQTGFDVFFKDGYKSYCCFFGAAIGEYNLRLNLECGDGIEISRSFSIKNLKYGQAHIIYLNDFFKEVDYEGYASLRIIHDLDVFPRFYVGIIKVGEYVPTLTHTFPDTSLKIFKEKGINYEDHLVYRYSYDSNRHFGAATVIPIPPCKGHFVQLKSYGQNLDFVGVAYIRIMNSVGEILLSEKISSKKHKSEIEKGVISFNAIIERGGLDECNYYFAYIGFDPEVAMPQRFKISLNISKKENNSLGTNICFAPLINDGKIINKPFTRRWFPIGGQSGFIGFVHATDLVKESASEKILITLEIVSSSNRVIERRYEIQSNGSLIIDPSSEAEIYKFLNGEIGWCYVHAERYMLDSYFISSVGEQLGGDHSF